MVKDLKNGQCHRADKLIDEAIEKMLGKKGITEAEKARLEKI
jgi:glycyl-tRNA synthetase (class II)